MTNVQTCLASVDERQKENTRATVRVGTVLAVIGTALLAAIVALDVIEAERSADTYYVYPAPGWYYYRGY
jgi:hypothetical protein